MRREIRKLAWELAAHGELLALGGARSIPVGLELPRAATPATAPSDANGDAPIDESSDAAMDAAMDQEAAPQAEAADASSHDLAARVAAASDLDALRGVIGDCTRCRLAGGRTHLVFGVGNPKARLMFVGEGPGRDEDLQGEPFVGRAGALLTDIIEKGMRLKRSDVYICNVVKCRPPNNRNPEPDEVEACSPFLLRQVDLVAPEVIVALGKFAAQTLLRTTTPIMRLRGVWHEYRGIPLMPTLHPAYLLRNPGDKKLVWQDIKQVMARLGLDV
ncbi:MAG TPA: uracil-DNA glycosylase [Candidatus Binatia bacterium]